MNETQRNIKRYQAALPGIRERIMASAMLLLVSLSMVVSASFAWMSISTAPEVSMMATTVASNGNLEIALAGGLVSEDREEPEEVDIGQSSSTQGQNLVAANVTWGNLVNLSDSSYGLSQISLRPSKLSDTTPSRTPLYGVDYTLDGRIQEATDYYRFASWGEEMKSFVAGEGVTYGVRAISSMKMISATVDSEIVNMAAAARLEYEETIGAYNAIITSDPNKAGTHMNALIKLLENFVNDRAKEVMARLLSKTFNDPANYGPNVPDLHDLLVEYQNVLAQESDTICQIANMHIFSNTGKKTDFIADGAAMRAMGKAELKALGIPDSLINVWNANKKDYTDIAGAITGIENNLLPIADQEHIYWSLSYKKIALGEDAENTPEKFLETYISKLVNINLTYVGSKDENLTKVVNMGGTAALDLLNANPIIVVIGDSTGGGVLKNTEDRIGPLLRNNDPKGIGTRVTVELKTGMSVPLMKVDGPKNAAVRTSASGIPTLLAELNKAELLKPEPTDMVSKDIYGFAMDLWVRTNAMDTILTLEGMTIYEEVDATCTNINGGISLVKVATGKVTGEDGELAEHVVDVYILPGQVPKKDANGEPVTDANGNTVMRDAELVYDALAHGIIGVYDEMVTEEGGDYIFAQKKTKIYKGYNGENRVWQEMIDGGIIPEDSTTQGAGSCYVFYASPADQPRILEMLQSFTVAFLNGDGNLMATAKLNTEEAFDINGKVTVPLKVVSGVAYEDEVTVNGITETVQKYGITAMNRSEATWITAIVYLDGDELGNDNVLAAGSIEGRLNLQFGSSVDINSQKNEELLNKYRTITAVVEGNGAIDDGSSETPNVQFDYDKNVKTVTARLTIDGDQPANVTAFFTRMVGQNQGTRMETEVFRKVSDKVWEAEFDLVKPGEYRLNSVVADGTEYVLEMKPGVEIKGQTVGTITCQPSDGTLLPVGGTVMTSNGYYDMDVSVEIQAEKELQPEKVNVLFSYGQDKTATAILGNDGDGNWTGTLRVTETGNYVMTYLVMDGNMDPVAQNTSFFARVGVDAEINCANIWDSEGKHVADGDNDAGSYTIMFEPQGENGGYTVEMHVQLRDAGGNGVTRMSGLKLVYPMNGNPDKKMDADLIWVDSAEGGYYRAEMLFKEAGTFQFGWVTTDTDEIICLIDNASFAMRVVAVPPDPPAIPEMPSSTVEYQFVPNGDAVMSVNVYDSSAAEVWALIQNQITGEEELVYFDNPNSDKDGRKDITSQMISRDGTHKTMEQYTFMVPTNKVDTSGKGNYVSNFSGKQDGIWVLKALYMQQVTDEEDNYYPGAKGEYLIFELADQDIQTEVMQTIFTEFSLQGAPYNNAYSFSGPVLQTHTVSNVKFRISDWRGSVERLSNVKLEVLYAGDAMSKGGYSVTGAKDRWNWLNPGSTASAENNLSALNLQVAGTYTVNLSYTITVGETTTNAPAATVITYTVSTPEALRPTVAITGTSLTVGASVEVDDAVETNNDKHGNKTVPAWTSTRAEVYITCKKVSNGCGNDHKYTRPTVTIDLKNKGEAESAVLGFTSNASDVYIYDGSTNSKNYTWNSDGSQTRTIGYQSSDTAKKAAQTLTATELKLTANGITCTFTLATPIVIENPC